MIPVSRLFSGQDESSILSTYTLKGIDHFERIGSFSKERAAIEEEYSAKLKNLTKKYARRAEDDEIWKNVTFIQGFNGVLHQVDLISNFHHEISEQLKNEVQTYVSSKSVQLKSSRKQTLNDLTTIGDELNTVINELFKAKKNYLRHFKEAESAHVKYTKADKNMEISRLELEKAKTFSTEKSNQCEESKMKYATALEAANRGQLKYFDKLLPLIFEKFKSLDQERINDTKDVLQKFLNIEKANQINIDECRKNMQQCIDYINPDKDASLLLESAQSIIERPPEFEFDDLGDPTDVANRPADYLDGRKLELFLHPLTSRKKTESPGKKKSIRQLFRMREKSERKGGSGGHSEDDDESDYIDLPPRVRLRCLTSKIGKLEKMLDKSIQGREGLNKLQNAYRENPKLGNPSDCNEQLYQHAKEIEKLTTRIEDLRQLYSDVEAAVVEAGSERSFGGRDTPDTTRSISGCSTILSSRTSTLEEAGLYGEGISDLLAQFSLGSSNPNSAQRTSIRRTPSTSTCPSPARVSGSGPIHHSTPLTHRSVNSPLRRRQISTPKLKSTSSEIVPQKPQTSTPKTTSMPPTPSRNSSLISKNANFGIKTAIFAFEGDAYKTISMEQGEEVLLLEMDSGGDGWTKVRKISNKKEGFVPTSYLE